MDLLVGADPEIFVRDAVSNELVSAYGLIPGTKKAPHKVEKGAVQVDGMALEFNIEPASNLKEWRGNINAVVGQLQHMIGDKLKLDISPTAQFGHDMINKQPQEARDLGCEPDYDAYTGKPNPKPNVDAPFRTASGHIHIGWTEDMDPFDPDHFEACCMLTKQLDIALAPLSRFWDKDEQRRELYGKLGAFRPKPFGVEYRVLSNAWLKDPNSISLVYDVAINATNALLQGTRYFEDWDKDALFNSSNPWDWYIPREWVRGRFEWSDWLGCLQAEAIQEYDKANRPKANLRKDDPFGFLDIQAFAARVHPPARAAQPPAGRDVGIDARWNAEFAPGGQRRGARVDNNIRGARGGVREAQWQVALDRIQADLAARQRPVEDGF